MSYWRKLTEANKSTIKKTKVTLVLDYLTCESILAFIYKDSVLRTRKALTNIRKMFDRMEMSSYEGKPEIQSIIWVIQKTLEARLEAGFEN